jgi:hypothetical protein
VVAEPHPALEGFPIYIGNIKDGIEWTLKNKANRLISKAQSFVTERFSPQTLIEQWKTATARPTTLDVAQRNGTDVNGKDDRIDTEMIQAGINYYDSGIWR